jgi:hypothetical protein
MGFGDRVTNAELNEARLTYPIPERIESTESDEYNGLRAAVENPTLPEKGG